MGQGITACMSRFKPTGWSVTNGREFEQQLTIGKFNSSAICRAWITWMLSQHVIDGA